MNLIIPQHILNLINYHAEEEYPFECCGFLLGREESGSRIITLVERASNAKEGDKRRRFEITPEEYLQAERQAASLDLELLGVYHSHPDHPSEPSEHDRKQALPWFSYIIVSVDQGKAGNVQSWRLNDQRSFEEEELKTVTEDSAEQLKGAV